MYIINKKNLSNYLEYLVFCICFRCCDGDRLLGRLLGDDRTWSGRSRTSSAAQREPAAVGRTRCGCSEVLKLLRIEAENLWRFLLNKIEIEPYLVLSGTLFLFWDLECSRDLEFSRDLVSVFNLFYQNSKKPKIYLKTDLHLVRDVYPVVRRCRGQNGVRPLSRSRCRPFLLDELLFRGRGRRQLTVVGRADLDFADVTLVAVQDGGGALRPR